MDKKFGIPNYYKKEGKIKYLLIPIIAQVQGDHAAITTTTSCSVTHALLLCSVLL